MNLLLIDSGNSRLKWATLRQPYRRGQVWAAHGAMEWMNAARSAAALSRIFGQTGTDARIYACNVAGAPIEQALRAAASRAGLRAPHFMRSAAAAGGVRNGYPDAWRLGADRWVALIGARHEYPGRDLCLVSVGTAMTIDLLAADGQHFGGSIVPGPQLMIESLLQRTAGIGRRAGGQRASNSFDQPTMSTLRRRGRRAVANDNSAAGAGTSSALFASNTRAALLQGARYASAALIERALIEARRRLGRRPRLILAGGATDAISPLLHSRYWQSEDLVLRGLAVLSG